MQLKAAMRWSGVTLLVGFGIGLAGCAPLQSPVVNACGVIVDPLEDVHATTRDGDRRISDHFERGVRAGCWSRK